VQQNKNCQTITEETLTTSVYHVHSAIIIITAPK